MSHKPPPLTMHDRAAAAGHIIVAWLTSALNWLFVGRWRRIKDGMSAYLSAHPHLETVVFFVAIPPIVIVFYTASVIFLAFEMLGKEVGEWWGRLCRWWREPRRELLGKEEVKMRMERKEERERVKELPMVRPRALTLRVGEDEAGLVEKEKVNVKSSDRRRVKQRTIDQLGGCELWKFPLEVREVIWKYAVGGNHIHIVKRRGKFGNVYCPTEDPTDPVHRDFCVRRDDEGFYVKSAWPKDAKPLALLVSCRQIYSECIDFLYSHNTFAFDDPALLLPFLGSLLPHRSQLVASFHFAPSFAREWSDLGQGCLAIANQPSVSHTINHLGHALNVLARRPTLYSLSITPKLRLNFQATCDAPLRNFIRNFTHALNKMKAPTPITLAWPVDPATYAPITIAPIANLSTYWGRHYNLPKQETRHFEIRDIPWQAETLLMAFFIPFDVQCLHCASYTLIRRATKGFAEVSFLPLSPSLSPPANLTIANALVRYWTFHALCGGWIEFQYHGGRKEWSVAQGAQRVSVEDADRHIEDSKERYPEMENAHERLRGITVREVVADARGRAWTGLGWYGTRGAIDEPTREACYRNVGWGRGVV